jgi:hypothetical protein
VPFAAVVVLPSTPQPEPVFAIKLTSSPPTAGVTAPLNVADEPYTGVAGVMPKVTLVAAEAVPGPARRNASTTKPRRTAFNLPDAPVGGY